MPLGTPIIFQLSAALIRFEEEEEKVIARALLLGAESKLIVHGISPWQYQIVYFILSPYLSIFRVVSIASIP